MKAWDVAQGSSWSSRREGLLAGSGAPGSGEAPRGAAPSCPSHHRKGELCQPSARAGCRRSCLAVSAVESSASRRGREPPVQRSGHCTALMQELFHQSDALQDPRSPGWPGPGLTGASLPLRPMNRYRIGTWGSRKDAYLCDCALGHTPKPWEPGGPPRKIGWLVRGTRGSIAGRSLAGPPGPRYQCGRLCLGAPAAGACPPLGLSGS